MRRSTRFLCGTLTLALAVAGGAAPRAGEPADGEIALKLVKYSELSQLVRSYKGKVVVVDFWAEY
jgi:hypothetical protein